jgi:hypothetical protein
MARNSTQPSKQHARKARPGIADNVTPATMLRLEAAAALGFPDGSMSAGALRRQAAVGHLAIYRIAGKDYTTLANIEEMKTTCRVPAKGPTSTTTSSGACCTSETDNSNVAIASMKMTARALKEHLQNTSSRSMTRKGRSTKIIPIKPK